MDGFTEKKWFVYLGDHHEGPFSLEEIQAKLNQGQLSSTNYIWAEGMTDWKLMSTVPEFESILLPPVAPPTPPSEAAAQFISSGPELAPVLSSSPASSFTAISLEPEMPVAEAVAAPPPILESAGPALFAEPQGGLAIDMPEADVMSHPETKKALAAQMVKIAALLLLIAGIGIAYNEGYLATIFNSQSVRSLTESLTSAADPLLSKLGFSPIPKLADVDADEYDQLKMAAKANIDQSGPRIAVALSKSDLLVPSFYIGTNLPDGAILDVYIEGISDSLLNVLSYNVKTQFLITKKFGKSSPIQFAQGSNALPRGQYTLYVVDPETQPAHVKPLIARMEPVSTNTVPSTVPRGMRIIASKAYFLGGTNDATYTARLQEFHAKITEKAKQELIELKQISMTLESQLNETNQKFASLKKGRKVTAVHKSAWDGFHGSWTTMNTQLSKSFQKTPETLQNSYFYGPMYQMGQQIEEKLSALHNLQNSFFAGTVPDPKSFEIQLGEAGSIARSSIEELKAKIAQAENQPPTPSGLPKRDGI